MKNILFIVPSDYDSLKKKGVVNLILERDEDGFFDNVLTFHPFTKNNRIIQLSNNNKIIEYGWKSKISVINKYLITKILGTVIILFKLMFIFPFVIKKEKISIIRATDPYYMGLIGLYYSKLFNIPLVVSIHSDYDIGEKLGGQTLKILSSRKLAKKLEKFIYKYCDLILPIREYLKQKIIKEFKIDSTKIKIFPHGINFNEFTNTKPIDIYKKFKIDRNKKIISFIGRLSKENYVYHLLDIVSKMKKSKLDFVLLILGEGNEYNNMKKIAIKKHLEDNIYFVGFQNKEVVINTRKQSYISLCLMGGFSLIEACAGARPVISYDIEWHHELVINNKTGFLVKENDINTMVEKIEFLFDHNNIANKYGSNARELAFKRHNIIDTLRIKQNIYSKVLHG